RLVQTTAFFAFAAASVALMVEIFQGAMAFGRIWALPLTVIAAYAAADFISGFVHFLADNFGSPETPLFGKAFVLPFREHHTDPKGILRHPFMIANGNNCLVALPPLLAVLFLVPVSDTLSGYLFGAFFLSFSIAIFLTNQFHKWAHMDSPPHFVRLLQDRGIILSKEHHDIHHVSPFDTHYCITTGWWNAFLHRIQFFERIESVVRGKSIRTR
ncbi:MAG: fatty acid desaturase family protein, partial [Gemmatimonadaceae bacterium]